jgi:tetratricopeptide (TPR) repeat protein
MILLAALMQAAALGEPSGLDARLEARFQACAAGIEAAPEAAYESAMSWANESYAPQAIRCAGLALIEMGRIAEGADKLYAVGATSAGGPPALRIAVLTQAANAYLLARAPDRAKLAMDRAIALAASDDPGLADLYIDRARAFAMLGQWRQSEEDLSAALDRRGADALALRLRATARMRQSVFDLALKDAEAAVAIDPRDVDSLLVRGQALEAKRTGAAPE